MSDREIITIRIDAIEYEKQRSKELIQRCNDLFPKRNRFVMQGDNKTFTKLKRK